MKKQFRTTAVHRGMVHMMLLTVGGAALAQSPAEKPPASLDTVVVTGQRAALQTAQKIKQNAEEIVDSVVAEEAGKLPDKSITEVLQRVVGVIIDRNKSRGDPEHFSVEGSGISVRGLSWGSSLLNGRESFSAGWPGRELSWGDIPPELMAGVDVYKNPSSEIIEGGVSGTVNLRTALPFDYKATKAYMSVGNNYVQRSGKNSPNLSGLYTTQWNTDIGRVGVLLDLSYNHSSFQNESIQLDAYYPRTDLIAGQVAWAPKSASFRNNTGDNERAGFYGALQWKKGGMDSSLTYFVSGARETGSEQGFYTGVENPYKSTIADAKYDANNVLTSGTYTYLTGAGANTSPLGGLGLQITRGWNQTTSKTGELAWNFKWAINDQWLVQNDVQWVHAKNDAVGRNLQLGTFVPSMSIDVPGKSPVRIGFDQTSRDFLAKPENYYWNLVMPSASKADADLYAWKADARYRFDDPILRDIRVGVRATYRVARHYEASGNGWTSVAEPWNVKQNIKPGQMPPDDGTWQSRGSFAYMGDPRYQGVPVETFNFGNFYGGKVGTLPNIVMPTIGAVRDYPNAYKTLVNDYGYQQCLDGNKLYPSKPACKLSDYEDRFKTLVYDGDPSKTSTHSEQTDAVYTTLRFGFDDWKFPLEGNAGVRVVLTRDVSHGYSVFETKYDVNSPPDLPRFDLTQPIDVQNQFVKVLPSLNLKMNFTDRLQARLAMAQSMNRPGFNQLGEYIKLQQNYNFEKKTLTYTGNNTGNVKLKPITANSYDLALEWYPRDGQSLTATAFHKDVKDVIMNSAYSRAYDSTGGNPQIFAITGPANVGKAKVGGLEVAGMTYLDKLAFLEGVLPDWAKGIGVSANYTYIDAKQSLYKQIYNPYCDAGRATTNGTLHLFGCDTNGLPFSDLPLPYMAKNAYNFVLMYDRGPLSARLAYNWHSRILQSADANGTRGEDATSADPSRPGAQDVGWGLPTWQEAFGQWDAGMNYRFSDALSMSLNVTNLNNVIVRQTQQQHIGVMGRAWFYPGRSYSLSARYEF
ncbi:TonB-dependent receptor [Pelomonas saccharophila]|uniref:TonB-dependent receptor n=1 Tax=Roseateles saccharophilus TaxID=304 RepID=A0ABU1YG47_ROSSA|nr:TonB-dependent receptor [Roseateles saccharophilus]MDR7267824.1 TonB-dependent receptor [Roseateles saccharophilus]